MIMDGVCLCVWDTDCYQIDNRCKCENTEERKHHEYSVPHHPWSAATNTCVMEGV